ncbi:bifunctional diguanylate cyclase/phosphodiesterase [Phreatobacter stygius]|uniref:EAL domain-containing protein n=1 Tax=Phreatobacter stygius TaxID=1940610 RepID=A0A4D7B9I2_9HYPH|nr:EAL domain-containing protein [Phreatobacter stygius]QCI67200.1 EAL domain-containing protein [Phreatobacter stygius]
MLQVYGCFVTQHDLRLVALAAVVCALASYTAVSLVHHVRASEGQVLRHRLWLPIAAIATGFGIWATHFIAMLAFQPGLPSGYNIALTVLSLLAAIVLTGVGLAIGVSRIGHGRLIGGAVVGGGIAAMHYTGMAAFEIAGRIEWDPVLVLVSIVLGAALGALALQIGLSVNSQKCKILGAATLTVAICSHHFTAMGAAAIIPDPMVVVSPLALPAEWLSIAVALASATIILLALAGLSFDLRNRREIAMLNRMRELADAAVEGLIVCDDETIVAANKSFRELGHDSAGSAIGRRLAAFFPDAAILARLAAMSDHPLEANLLALSGETIPVELIQHVITYAGRPHRVIAVRDLRDRKKAEQQIHFLAHHDSLTTLPNRTSFNRKLELELAAHGASGRCFAVIFLDLDRFKEINDLFGHLAGDAVLQFVSQKVRDVLGADQMVARLGGDEFAIIAPNLGAPMEAGHIAETILEALGTPDSSLPAGISIGTSIGIAIYPNDATDRSTLLSYADAALYEAKAEGRGIFRFFEAAMGTHLRERRQIEHDLRHAIPRDELRLVFQPQTRLNSEEILGFEVLLRWRHGTRGDISPSVFIPVAEECGVILQLGEWVLRTACAEAASWHQPLAIAVNVSRVQLHNGNLPQLVQEILATTGLAPERLELEVTETALIKDFDRALATLQQIKALGVKLAMDDFGTGYSSLSNLRAFPFDKIKIDQSFVRSVDSNEQSATIVRAIVGLAKGLNLPVLAEGVETADELRFLCREDCNEAQGYYLGRPGPIEQFRYLVDRETADSEVVWGPSQRIVSARLG